MRLSPTQQVSVVVLGVLAVAAMAAGMALPDVGQSAPDATLAETRTPVEVIHTECEKVQIYSSVPGLPYTLYATEIRRILEDSGPVSDRPVHLDKAVEVEIPGTTGAVTNIANLKPDPRPDCRLALTQMNVAADAVEGFYEFRPGKIGPIRDLRAVGFISFDIVHMIVRDDSGITSARQLCGRTIGAALPTSGSAQMVEVLEKILARGEAPGCEITSHGTLSMVPALDALERGEIDAVVWVAGSPTQVIQDKAETLRIRLLPMGEFRQPFQDDFDALYRTLEPDRDYYQGDVFEPEDIEAGDYQNVVGTVPTFMVPNGIVVRSSADAGLVRFLTQALFTERTAFERQLWEREGDRKGRSFPGPELVSGNPLFCYVRPHDAAEDFYQDAADRGGYTYLGQCEGD